jgi:protein kinase C substrate 80K-H
MHARKHRSFRKAPTAAPMMRFVVALTCAAVSLATATASVVKTPRHLLGVDPALKHLYASSSSSAFVCDGNAKTIPLSRVNDEYCDCDDGSDEPGTSACAGRRESRGFYCVNAGATPLTVPASRVDDGVCDCCDGSDETTNGWKKIECENTCVMEARARRVELVRRIGDAKKGLKAKASAESKSSGARRGWEKELAHLESGVAGQREGLESLKLAAEEAEEEERKLKEEEAEKKAKEEEARRANEAAAMATDASDAEDGGGEMQPLDYGTGPEDSSIESDTAEVSSSSSSSNEESAEERGKRIASQWISDEGQPDESAGEEPAEMHDESFDTNVYSGPDTDDVYDEDMEEERSVTSKIGSIFGRIAKKFTSRSADARLAAEAKAKRAAYQDELNKVNDAESKIETLKKNLDRNYGPNGELLPLVGQCFEARVDKYKYKACPFGEAKQDGTRLGSNSDTEVSDAGELMLKFTEGERCWNGPSRSLALTLKCGDRDSLESVEEPSRCEYSATLYTPQACKQSDVDALETELADLEAAISLAQSQGRDEL